MIKRLWSKILAAFFPKRCPFCEKFITEPEDYCETCARKLPKITYRRFAAGGYPCCAPLLYQGEYAGAVKRYKYRGIITYARPFALLMVKAAECTYDLSSVDAIICVPMHKNSEMRRPFNQSEKLAREFSALTGIPFIEALEKYKINQPQHSLKRKDREKNVKGVYRVTDKSLVKNKRILLVDDIITTGNTLGECARKLQKSGCKEVICAVVCSTML